MIMSATGVYAQAVGSTFQVGNHKYTITKNDLVNHVDNEVGIQEIGGSGAVTIPATVTHPQSLEVYKVTSAIPWTNCSKTITSLTFSEGFKTMGNGCYGTCTELRKVTFPSTFESLGHSCFENCKNFTAVEVASGNGTYKHNSQGWLISNDGKTLVLVPSGVSGDVSIPNTIETIGQTAFKTCPNLEKINIPASVKSIDATINASIYASSTYITVDGGNTYYKDINGVLVTKDGRKLITFPAKYSGTLGNNTYKVPDGVKTIASEAFGHATPNLKKINLNQVETIEGSAFDWASGLKEVTFGASVSSIAEGAFVNCENLEKFIVDTNNPNYKSRDDIIYTKNGETLVLWPTKKTGHYNIPEDVKYIQPKAFYGTNITSVKFPSTLEEIGVEAFRFCKLETLDFGTNSHLKKIRYFAFANTEQLTGGIVIPASVETIEGEMFHWTYKVTSVHIADGSKLKEIYSEAFINMQGLETFVFDGSADQLTNIHTKTFANNPKLKHFEVPQNVTSIGKGAFLDTPSLETVTFKTPAHIATIGNGAFGNSGIKTISLPESVTKIGEQAFDNCKNLETISIPKNVANIETGAFNFCEALTAFNVDKDNTTYADLDGMLCTKNKKTLVTFPAGKADTKYTLIPYFETVGQYAFYSSDKVTNITFPKSVTEIKTRALALCKNLKSLSFMGTDNVPALSADITFNSANPKDIAIYVRKAWYENSANASTVTSYNNTFKEVHPSFVSTAGYDRGTEFFPTSTDNVGVISFYTPRTSVIIDKVAKETAYTDVYGKTWPEKTYTVSSVLDFAYQNESRVKDIVLLADIGAIGLDAFRAGTQLKGLYFVGNTPASLSSIGYEMPSDYPFNEGQAIYVKESKVNAYQTAWTQGHTLNITHEIPQQTNKNGGTVCFPFDVKYPQGLGASDIKPYVPMDYSLAYNATNPIVRAYSVDNYYLPAFVGAFIRSKNTASVASYCQMDEEQAHDKSALTTLGYSTTADNRMVGAVEDTPVTNESGYQCYAFSKQYGKLVKLGDNTNIPYFKAYLRLKNNAASPAKGMSLVFDDEPTVTGINGISETAEEDNAPYYNLNGMRVDHPQKGVYIHNGKKVIIK